VYHGIDSISGKDIFHFLEITDIGVLKKISFPAVFTIDVHEVLRVAGIGELVHIDDTADKLGILKDIPDKIRADKSRTAGYEDVGHFSHDTIHHFYVCRRSTRIIADFIIKIKDY